MEPIKLQKIDESLLSEYSYLEETDRCYFMGEYAARQGFDHINPNQVIENMNQIINNFKKPVERKDRPEWRYKEKAISEIANWIISTTSWDKLKTATWIPIPPSKIKSDPHYDDRLLRVLLKMKENENSLNVRELLLTKSSREAAHNPGSIRPKVQDHLKNFVLDDTLKTPKPRAMIVFDDIITSGAHFKAAQTILQKEFPEVPIIGVFIGRTVQIED